jgi:hypothetical protein
MRVAVVILNWNGKSFLEKFLPGVIEHSPEATVYVADNASTDDSVEFLQRSFPNIEQILIDKNLGFAAGYNRALENLSEEFFVLLNSDVEVTSNWLQPLIELMDSDDLVAACQPKVLQYDRKTHFEYAGAAGGFIDKLGYPFCRGRIFDTLEHDSGQYDSVQEVFWATGACLVFRSSIYHKLGGLDSDFFAHMEEIDLCWRTKRAGLKIMVQPKSVVYHVGGGTLSRSNPQKTFLNFRNGLELLAKNLPKNRLISTFFLRLILDGVAGLKFLLSGNVADFWAIIRAHFAFYGRLKSTLAKRSGNFPNISPLYNRSIVVAYYLRGKKRFNDLGSNDF